MRILIYLAPLLLLLGCQKYTTDTLPDNRLHFGNSGGFSGEIREYVLLLDSGKILFDNQQEGKVEKIGKLSKEKFAALRVEIAEINFAGPAPRPANRNTAVTLYRNGEAHQLQWAGTNAPDAAAGRCFTELMAEVRKMRGTE